MNGIPMAPYYVMDLFPPQTEQQNRLHPFYRNLQAGRFTTTECRACGRRAWPPRTLCPYCYSDDLDWVDLPASGTIFAVTRLEAGIPLGFEPPLDLAVIELGEFRIASRLIEVGDKTISIGDRVELAVIPLSDGRVTYAFRPTAADSG